MLINEFVVETSADRPCDPVTYHMAVAFRSIFHFQRSIQLLLRKAQTGKQAIKGDKEGQKVNIIQSVEGS